MKRIILFVILFAMCCGLLSCSPEQTGELEFTSNGDGTCVLSGIGTFSGTALVIPTHSPEGALLNNSVEIAEIQEKRRFFLYFYSFCS